MKVVVIIISFNGMQWIERCLRSCAPYAVIVIDNNSSDGTQAFITANFPNVNLIENNKNTGFGNANNVGVKKALKNNCDFVFLLNQDAYLFPDTISTLLKFQKDNQEYGIVSPLHLDGSGQRFDENFSNHINASGFEISAVEEIENISDTHIVVPFVNAAGWLLSKDAIQKVGLFDPLFFMYGEDDNMCQRMRYHGYQIAVVPAAKMIHDRSSKEEKVIVPFSQAYFNEARILYLRKFADITNCNYQKDLQNTKRDIKKRIKENGIRFRFLKCFNYYKQFRLLKNLQPEIEDSRKKNIIINQA